MKYTALDKVVASTIAYCGAFALLSILGAGNGVVWLLPFAAAAAVYGWMAVQ